MKERFKKISAGLLIILLSLVGLWEYMQLYLYFDIPQAVVLLPVAGALSAIFLKKLGWVVPGAAILICIVYQMVEKRSSSVGIVETSKIKIILYILPVVIILMLLGMAGGFLVRVLIRRKRPLAVGILCGLLGVLITFGGSVVMFGNPLYPFMAKAAVDRYAKKFESDSYKISEVSVYYSLEDLQYQGRVVMSDGIVYALYHDRGSGEVTESSVGE
ncbi:MAG: hypothetical protein HFG35_05215 [Eubacterium sp.]|jgi:hypothetical protein|nr:hypothetical protein [Eubacterium sp.]